MGTCVLTALLTIGVSGQPVYKNSDIESLRVRYEGPRVKRFPAQFWDREYATPAYQPWELPWRNWEKEYRKYFQRHYKDPSLTFQPKPSLICMHYTVMTDAQSVWDHFAKGCRMSAGDKGTVFGHVSVQVLIDKDGTVYQLMPLERRCTGA